MGRTDQVLTGGSPSKIYQRTTMKAVFALLLVCLIQISFAEEQESINSEGNLLLQREARDAAKSGCKKGKEGKDCRKRLRKRSRKGKQNRNTSKPKTRRRGRTGTRKAKGKGTSPAKGEEGKNKGGKGKEKKKNRRKKISRRKKQNGEKKLN